MTTVQLGIPASPLNKTLNSNQAETQTTAESQSNSASANCNVVSACNSFVNNNQPRKLPVISDEYGFKANELCRNQWSYYDPRTTTEEEILLQHKHDVSADNDNESSRRKL